MVVVIISNQTSLKDNQSIDIFLNKTYHHLNQGAGWDSQKNLPLQRYLLVHVIAEAREQISEGIPHGQLVIA
jgi:hypothetical protein